MSNIQQLQPMSNNPMQVQIDRTKLSLQKWLIKLKVYRHIFIDILDLTPVDIICGCISLDYYILPTC